MKLFNTMTRRKEEFVPVEPGKAKIYACGPTVYNFFHIGNARPFIIFDTLRRYFEYIGYDVTFVQNFTDVDDKMIARAAEEKTTLKELGERFIKAYFEDAQGLGIRPTVHPKATEQHWRYHQTCQPADRKGHAYEWTATCTSTCPASRATASSPASRRKNECRARASTLPTKSVTPRISRCGRLPSPARTAGILHGARAGPAGISSAAR